MNETHGFSPAMSEPLRITVTDAGRESVTIRALLRRAVPLLRTPDIVERSERLELVREIQRILAGAPDDAPPALCDADAPPSDDGAEAGYGPGAWL